MIPLLNLYSLVEEIVGVPEFQKLIINDRNPLSGARKRRIIYAPNDPMRELHSKFIELLRKSVRFSQAAYGAVPGGSPVKHVRRHRANRFLYLVDLSNAYRSVKGELLAKIVASSLGSNPKETFTFLTKYFLAEESGLRTGGPASPDMFNLYAGRLIDTYLLHLCHRYSLVYTRYIDDLAFSSSKVPIGKKKRRAIRRIVEQFFVINHRKCRVLDLRKQPIHMNGVGLRLGGTTFLPRRYIRRINGLLHAVIKDRGTDRQSVSRLHGMMGLFLTNTDSNSKSAADRRLLGRYRLFKIELTRDKQ